MARLETKASTTPGEFPAFEPFPGLSGGHAQTILARYLPGRRVRLASRYVEIPLSDGDRLSLLDSAPKRWERGGPVALLVHGLAGCARSPYVARVAARLYALGVRVVRMNLRGAGSGVGAARGFYHAGRTEDLRATAAWIASRAPGSPIALVGFSLGANLVLKLAAEASDEPLDGLDCVLAANPPLDLAECCRFLQRPGGRIYDQNFIRLLHSEVRRVESMFPDLGRTDLSRSTSLFDFDDLITAPRNGFRGAVHYYESSSAGPLLRRIAIPGLVVHAVDDPFIPPDPFYDSEFPESLRLELMPSGGHLGYLDRRRFGDDHRWLDARFTEWLRIRWDLNPESGPAVHSF